MSSRPEEYAEYGGMICVFLGPGIFLAGLALGLSHDAMRWVFVASALIWVPGTFVGMIIGREFDRRRYVRERQAERDRLSLGSRR